MSIPAISVYMTVKNGLPWVESAVRSIQDQTFQDWELVIVDDGSSDNTHDLLVKMKNEDPRIILIPTKGVGRGKALNIALSKCRADFVANLDADDLAHPERLEIQYESGKKHTEFNVFCSQSLIINKETRPEWQILTNIQPTLKDVTRLLVYRNPINHSSVFARRGVFLKVGGYSEELFSQFDYDLWVKIATGNHRIARIELPLVAKRWHENQSFETKKHFTYVLRSLKIQRRAIKALQGGALAWFYMIARLPWGLLPRNIRQRYQEKKITLYS